MKKPLIIGLGEIVWDCLPDGKKLGGAPVNFAYHAGQLGADSFPVSAVGKDELGAETLAACKGFGLNTTYIQENSLPTSRVLVKLDAQGVPNYTILENVAWDALEATPLILGLASKADAVCWGSLAQRNDVSRKAVLEILDAAPDRSMKVFDINLRQHYYSREIIEASLERASVLKLNEDELPAVVDMLSLSGIDDIVARYSLQFLIYTCGAAYSEVYGPDGLISHIETPKVEVADTVGAGDSFTAAFVTSILQGAAPADAHATAVELSANVCKHHGAMP